MYAIKNGDRAGGFVIWMKERSTKSVQAFLYCPNPMEIVFFTLEEVKASLKSRELDYVELLPEAVYEVSLASFDHYKRKQEDI